MDYLVIYIGVALVLLCIALVSHSVLALALCRDYPPSHGTLITTMC